MNFDPSAFCLLSVGITGARHHTQFVSILYKMFKKTLEIRFRGDLTEARIRAPCEASSMQQDSCGISVCLGRLRKSKARQGRDKGTK